MLDKLVIDATEAPPGFYAVLKSAVANDNANICRQCDWRMNCNGFTHRCMSYELENGLKRKDSCSVVFKRLP